MLIINRRDTETLRIGDDIVIHIFARQNSKAVKVGVDAPSHVKVLRGEAVKDVGTEASQGHGPAQQGGEA